VASSSAAGPQGTRTVSAPVPPPLFAQSPSPWGSPAPLSTVPTRTGWSAKLTAVVVAVAVAVIGGGWFYLHRGPHITMPEAIMGIQKMDTPAAQIVEAGIRDRGKQLGLDAHAGLYGTSQAQPSIVVVTIASRASISADDLMREFSASAVNPNNSFKLNLLAVTRSTHDGADFICAPIIGQVNRSMCVWKDGKVLGVVGESELAVDPMTLTSIVRSAVEG
jgi:hypothetical protein